MQQMTISSSGAFHAGKAEVSEGNENRMYYRDVSEM